MQKVVFALLRLAIGIGILVCLVKSGRVELHSLTRVFRAWPLILLGVAVLLIDILLLFGTAAQERLLLDGPLEEGAHRERKEE